MLSAESRYTLQDLLFIRSLRISSEGLLVPTGGVQEKTHSLITERHIVCGSIVSWLQLSGFLEALLSELPILGTKIGASQTKMHLGILSVRKPHGLLRRAYARRNLPPQPIPSRRAFDPAHAYS